MFVHPIVFVLGAGASAEFRLPSGQSLKDKIIDSVHFRGQDFALSGGDRTLFEMLRRKFGREANLYIEAGKDLARAVTMFVSIDEVLHYFSGRPEVVELGKIAIVHELLRAERESHLFRQDDPRIANIDGANGSWLSCFLSMALSSLRQSEIKSAFENVTIINFNYDRTVEHYVYSALKMRAGVPEELAKAAVAKLQVIRPYGSIGPLHFQTGSDVGFGANFSTDFDTLKTITKNIRTYTEQQSSDNLTSEIQKAIESASTVVILGFGFHGPNLDLLHTTQIAAGPVFATVHGIDPENYEQLRIRLKDVLGSVTVPHLVPWTAHDLLNKMRVSVMAAASSPGNNGQIFRH